MAAIMALLLGESHSPVNLLAAKPDDAIHRKAFQKFISKYRRNYLTNDEYQARFDIFKKNLDYIMAHNSSSFKLSINAYADWSDEERETILQT
jgi:hypothetical protein